MALKPQLVSRDVQPYASITNEVPMGSLGEQLPPQIGEVFGWLAARGIQPAGPPFWKYNRIDMEGDLEVEVGVPTAESRSPVTSGFRDTCFRAATTLSRSTWDTRTSWWVPPGNCWTGPESTIFVGTCQSRPMVRFGLRGSRSTSAIRSASPTWTSGRRI